MYHSKKGGCNRATCLMKVLDGVSKEMVLANLEAASAAGKIDLQTMIGPRPASARLDAKAAHVVMTVFRELKLSPFLPLPQLVDAAAPGKSRATKKLHLPMAAPCRA
jgi:hypothetical protein